MESEFLAAPRMTEPVIEQSLSIDPSFNVGWLPGQDSNLG